MAVTIPELTDTQYLAELEKMVKVWLSPNNAEFFYYDALMNLPIEASVAYARATGDDSVLEVFEEE